MYNVITIVIYSILICGIHGRTFNGNHTSRIKRQDCNGFKCNSGECIENDLFCDGKENCRDGSDEISSECKKLSCPGYLFRCKYGACIDSNKVCNGQKDCKDFSDEQNCPTNDSCRNGQFKCANGECIPQDQICDGTGDCTDASDETSALCSTKTCPGYLYRCKYGACVDGFARCDGKKDCTDNSDEESCPPKKPQPDPVKPKPDPVKPQPDPVKPPPKPVVPPGKGCQLPPFPNNGKWEVQQSGNQNYQPGDYIIEWTTVLFSCEKGYILKDEQSDLQVCNPGYWLRNKPECLRLCRPIHDTPTTTMSCKLNGKPVSCLEPPEGTRLTYTCKQFYIDQSSSLSTSRRCSDGSWNDEEPKCVQDCGVTNAPSTVLVVGGEEVKLNEYPWHIGIFRKKGDKFRNICGGSLITPKLILSAAHCVTDQQGTTISTDNYKVGAGKHYVNFEDERDKQTAQYRDVLKILVPNSYSGIFKGYLGDISVIVVTQPFTYDHNVRPVCLDRRNDAVLQSGEMGKVLGWGYTTEGGNRSDVLKYIDLPYVDYATCYSLLPEDFRRTYFEKNDKMCAGYFNESRGVCNGDSGGGLVFRNREGKFYLRGVVSVTSGIVAGICNVNTFALFTRVADHQRTLIEDAVILYT